MADRAIDASVLIGTSSVVSGGKEPTTTEILTLATETCFNFFNFFYEITALLFDKLV